MRRWGSRWRMEEAMEGSVSMARTDIREAVHGRVEGVPDQRVGEEGGDDPGDG